MSSMATSLQSSGSLNTAEKGLGADQAAAVAGPGRPTPSASGSSQAQVIISDQTYRRLSSGMTARAGPAEDTTPRVTPRTVTAAPPWSPGAPVASSPTGHPPSSPRTTAGVSPVIPGSGHSKWPINLLRQTSTFLRALAGPNALPRTLALLLPPQRRRSSILGGPGGTASPPLLNDDEPGTSLTRTAGAIDIWALGTPDGGHFTPSTSGAAWEALTTGAGVSVSCCRVGAGITIVLGGQVKSPQPLRGLSVLSEGAVVDFCHISSSCAQYFSWNLALMDCGFNWYLIATTLTALAYLFLSCSIAEMTSALPFAGKKKAAGVIQESRISPVGLLQSATPPCPAWRLTSHVRPVSDAPAWPRPQAPAHSPAATSLPVPGGGFGFARVTHGTYLGYVVGVSESAEYILYVATSVVVLGEVGPPRTLRAARVIGTAKGSR